jgi:hypothetical protein
MAPRSRPDPSTPTCSHPRPRRWMPLRDGTTAKVCQWCAAIVEGPLPRCRATTRRGRRDCSLPLGHGQHPNWKQPHLEAAS